MANIFIPTLVVDGNAKHLRILLQKIIPITVYTVVQKELVVAGKAAESVLLKWVNDVLVDGKKICGIKPDDLGSNDKVISFQ
ncbi:MAG: hypothetical protein LBG20_01165 [Holosporaceae bacterium]|nr:hypothetical protein [Holosporaceae bacterium]